MSGRANDIKKHKWFEGLDWEALEARKVVPLRKPKEDSAKRLKELTVCVTHHACSPLQFCFPLKSAGSTGGHSSVVNPSAVHVQLSTKIAWVLRIGASLKQSVSDC